MGKDHTASKQWKESLNLILEFSEFQKSLNTSFPLFSLPSSCGLCYILFSSVWMDFVSGSKEKSPAVAVPISFGSHCSLTPIMLCVRLLSDGGAGFALATPFE